MSYPNITADNFLTNILNLKEFFSLYIDEDNRSRELSINDSLQHKYLKIQSHQLFIRNFMNPNTQYTRLHLMHMTGTGKTLGAIVIAHEFIKVYQQMFLSTKLRMQGIQSNIELVRSSPTVFVLGFAGTKIAFTKELLRYPEFGFVTYDELNEIYRLQKMADDDLAFDNKNLKNMYTMIKKRITNKSKGGFYKFYGYDEFVNRLFSSETLNLVDIEKEFTDRIKNGEDVSLENAVYDHIKNGRITVNQVLLKMFENSLLICDEVHNTYNMNMKNNRGIAIQFILDTVKSVRILTLSATPINNSPTEVVELINYLVPVESKITKQDLFVNNRTLKPDGLDKIRQLVSGKVSFLQDFNIKYYPKRIFVGEYVKIPENIENFRAGDFIPYLKFIPCEMSNLHQHTYDTHYADNKFAITNDAHSLYDLVFPNPNDETLGIFRSNEVKTMLFNASSAWKSKVGIKIYKDNNIDNNVITGDFLKKDNISVYSTKYFKLLEIIEDIIKSAGGDEDKCQKIMIYHHRVKMSGVLLIEELLINNGYLNEFIEPTNNTICCICGQIMANHPINDHDFKPVRFVIAHSNIDKRTMDLSLSKFNNPSNAHGTNIMILIASSIVKESYDFKDIQHLIITSLPINIPTLMQVFGRCIRKFSHVNLPTDQHVVNIRILLTITQQNARVSHEQYRYIDKLLDYMTIQKIEREFNRNAIDAAVYRNIIMPESLKSEYFKDSAEPIAMLGNLYFEPSSKLGDISEVSNITFNAYKYYHEEIKTICYLIKRLFTIQSVWTYDGLLKVIRYPPFSIDVNPKLFDEYNFIIALHNMVSSNITIYSAKNTGVDVNLVERLFDYNDRHVYINGTQHKIEHIGEYYILFPVSNMHSNVLNKLITNRTVNVIEEREQVYNLNVQTPYILNDVEMYSRKLEVHNGVTISINDYLNNSNITDDYHNKRARLISMMVDSETYDINDFLFDYTVNFQKAIIEECILFSMGFLPKSSKNEKILYANVSKLYTNLGVMILYGELVKYKDVTKQYKSALPTYKPDTIVGYITDKAIKLLDPTDMKANDNNDWFTMSKILMNKQVNYKESSAVIGYIWPFDEGAHFKIRRSVDHIKEVLIANKNARLSTLSTIKDLSRTTSTDMRLVERGENCRYIKKPQLLGIIKSLGIGKIDKNKIRISNLCKIIRNKIIELEIDERIKDSKYKYMYGWWDPLIQINI